MSRPPAAALLMQSSALQVLLLQRISAQHCSTRLQEEDDEQRVAVRGKEAVARLVQPMRLRPLLDCQDERPHARVAIHVCAQQRSVPNAVQVVEAEVHAHAVGMAQLQHGHLGEAHVLHLLPAMRGVYEYIQRGMAVRR